MRKNKSENGITLLTLSLVVVLLIVLGAIAINIKLNNSKLMKNTEEAISVDNAKHSYVNSIFNSELGYYPEASSENSDLSQLSEHSDLSQISEYFEVSQ